MKNFSRKSCSACSKVLSPELRPQDQSTHGLSGSESLAKKRKTPSVQPWRESHGTTTSAQLRCMNRPKSEKPLPNAIELHAPAVLPKRL